MRARTKRAKAELIWASAQPTSIDLRDWDVRWEHTLPVKIHESVWLEVLGAPPH